jgi:RNA polymerase sigma-B factor
MRSTQTLPTQARPTQAQAVNTRSVQRELRRTTTNTALRAAAAFEGEERGRLQDAIIVDYLDLADTLARRYAGASRDLDDLRQVACVGLIKAARRFRPDLGEDFISFAVPTVSGEIKRYLRDHGWFIRPPRRVQDLRSRILASGPVIAQELGRTPTPADLAHWLGETTGDVEEALLCHQSLRPASLDVVRGEGEALTLADTLGYLDPGLDKADLVASLAPAIQALGERDRRIVYLRFYEELTQQEIAADLGVTQMQVSRLLAKILTRLRLALHDEASAREVESEALPLTA